MNIILGITLLLLSVILGGFIVVYLSSNNKKSLIKILLAFSGGFLLSIAFIHFLPELYESKTASIGIYVLLGFLIQLLLEFFSGGIEHGHVHVHKGQAMPWGMFIALSIHSFIEGIPLGTQSLGEVAHSTNHSHDASSLLIGILLHQLPVAIALMTVLINTKNTNYKNWFVLMAFAVMTPLGMILGYSNNSLFEYLNFDIILAIVVGMFLHISTTIIFETSENHRFNLLKLSAIIGGCVLAFFII